MRGRTERGLGLGLGMGAWGRRLGAGKCTVSQALMPLEGVLERRRRFIFVQDPWLKCAGAVGHGAENHF